MSDYYKNKTAVITGAAIGIGYEIAVQLLQLGVNVLMNDIDQEALDKALKSVENFEGDCIGIVGDSANLTLIDALIETAVEKFGAIHFVIANSGITTFGDFLNYAPENFDKVVNVNLKGTFYLAQKAAKQFIKQKIPGRIVLMSSVTGHTFHPDLTAYGMSKAAIIYLAKNLGVELAKYNITVNAISPGATLTDRTIELENGDYQKIWEQTTPSGKVTTPKEIAHTTLFLLSENASNITGQTIVVDGGWTSLSPKPGM